MIETTLSPLAEQVRLHACAGFSGMYVTSLEPHEALLELERLSAEEGWPMLTWSLGNGVAFLPGTHWYPQTLTKADTEKQPGKVQALLDARLSDAPVEVVSRFFEALPILQEGRKDNRVFLWMQNLHREELLGRNSKLIQRLQTAALAGRTFGGVVGVVAPVMALPMELERLFVTLEHPLPGRPALHEIAVNLSDPPERPQSNGEWKALLDAAAGLTRMEAENAFSLSLARKNRLDGEVVQTLKHQMIRKSGVLSVYEGQGSFKDLGGMQGLKDFCLKSMRYAGPNQDAKPKGVLLIGPPGSGKSEFSKALGNEAGCPTIILDVGALMGSLVGQTEANLRQALRTIDAVGKCIIQVDELEKALAGSGGGGKDTSGVSSRMLGTLLTWMSDRSRDSDSYVIATSNDITQLPPELARAERFDAVVFLDLPEREEKDAIWRIYLEKFGLDAGSGLPADDKWTGAEIRSCCRLAALLGVPVDEAAQNVVPVAVTAAETVQSLRQWAKGRCLSASRGGLYYPHDETEPVRAVQSRRAVSKGKVKA